MSNASNLPPSTFKELNDQLKSNVQAIRAMNRSFSSYSMRLGAFFEPFKIAANSFQKMEEVQLMALAAGTTQAKFIEANTESLKGLQSANVSMTKFLIGGFTKGLRDVSRDTVELADEMIITGQSTENLGKVLGSVRLMTGNSINATSNLSKTIMRTSREQGISTGELINTLQGFQEAMLNASIYGEQAVEGIGSLGVALKGGLAGAAGADQAIGALLGMQDALNVAQQEQLGLRQFFDEIRTTGFNQERHMQMLVRAGENLNDMMGSDAMVRDAIAKGFGDKQVKALLLISKGIKNFEGLSEEEKKQREENQKSMVAYEQSKLKWYNDLAGPLHDAVVKYLPAMYNLQLGMQVMRAGAGLAQRGAAMGAGSSATARGIRNAASQAAQRQYYQSQGIRNIFQASAAQTAAAQRLGQRAAARAAAGGAMRLFAGNVLRFLGPLGAIASIGVSFGPSIINLLTGINENTGEAAEAAREAERRRREQEVRNRQRDFSLAARLSRELITQAGVGGTDAQLMELLRRLGVTLDSLNGVIDQPVFSPSPQIGG